MTIWQKGVLGAALALASGTAAAQERQELGIGVHAHAITRPFLIDKPPPGVSYITPEEKTVDIQVLYRTKPLDFALKPRLAAKVQINTAGKTSFASIGAEWRQHVFKRRVYGQIGIGLTVHDGYTNIPDPYDFAPGSADFWRRFELYADRTNFGSRVLFNPNLSVGVRVSRDWAIEANFEHFSHAGWFGRVNDGMETFGLRLVRSFGGRQ